MSVSCVTARWPAMAYAQTTTVEMTMPEINQELVDRLRAKVRAFMLIDCESRHTGREHCHCRDDADQTLLWFEAALQGREGDL